MWAIWRCGVASLSTSRRRATCGRGTARTGNRSNSIHADKLIVTAEQRDANGGHGNRRQTQCADYEYRSAKGPSEVSLVWVDPTSKRRFKDRRDGLNRPSATPSST